MKDIGFVSTASAPSFLHKICLERIVAMVRICKNVLYLDDPSTDEFVGCGWERQDSGNGFQLRIHGRFRRPLGSIYGAMFSS